MRSSSAVVSAETHAAGAAAACPYTSCLMVHPCRLSPIMLLCDAHLIKKVCCSMLMGDPFCRKPIWAPFSGILQESIHGHLPSSVHQQSPARKQDSLCPLTTMPGSFAARGLSVCVHLNLAPAEATNPCHVLGHGLLAMSALQA